MTRFEVWTSEKLSRAVSIPEAADNKATLDGLTTVYPMYVKDWVLDHTFEAGDEDAAALHMMDWAEAEAPRRELIVSVG